MSLIGFDILAGINLSFARLLLSRNCNVVFADIALRPEAQQTVDEHSSKDGNKARAVFAKCDVTIWDQLENMFEVADKEFGGADLVSMSKESASLLTSN